MVRSKEAEDRTDKRENDSKVWLEQNYSRYYSKDNFFKKLFRHYSAIGRKFVRMMLTMFFTLLDDDTPQWAKTIVVAALGYFIFPLDLVPDFLPVIGFSDDLATITIAFATVLIHIKEEHKNSANNFLSKFTTYKLK